MPRTAQPLWSAGVNIYVMICTAVKNSCIIFVSAVRSTTNKKLRRTDMWSSFFSVVTVTSAFVTNKPDSLIPTRYFTQSKRQWNGLRRPGSTHRFASPLTIPLCTMRNAYVFKQKYPLFSAPREVFSECMHWSGIIGEQSLVIRREKKGRFVQELKSIPP
jgi:hypothetical protein